MQFALALGIAAAIGLGAYALMWARYAVSLGEQAIDLAAEAYALADVSGRLALEVALYRSEQPIEIVEGLWRGEC